MEQDNYWESKGEKGKGGQQIHFKQSVQQKGHMDHKHPSQRRRKTCSKFLTLLFNGNKVTATFSTTVLYEQGALQGLSKVKALSSLKAYSYDNRHFELQQTY